MKLIKEKLQKEFKIKDLGQLKYFLGIEVSHSKLGIFLCQRKYCLDILQDSKMLCAKPASTPFDLPTKLHKNARTPYHDIPAYRSLVGWLLYLSATRPEITFYTQQLSWFLYAPIIRVHYTLQQIPCFMKEQNT